MAILNRTEDFSEQRKTFEINGGATATGATGFIGIVPYNSVIEAGQMAALGISGSPAMAINVLRFIAGTGYTVITVATGTSNLMVAYGTSGPGSFGASLFGASGMVLATTGASNVGTTLGLLLANDILAWQMSGTTSAVTGFTVGVVLRPLQDVKRHFNLI